LSRRLELGGGHRIREARRLADRIELDREQVQKERDNLRHQYDQLREKLAARVEMRWPELSHAWHPGASRIVEERAERILEVVRRGGAFEEMMRLRSRIQRKRERDLALERRWAKCRRLIRMAENVALAANLSKVASERVQEQYESLRAAEAATLQEAKPDEGS
jgi:hypothetical protein